MQPSRERLLRAGLPVLLGIALYLRATGIHWGIPDASHYFSFHPDEWVILGYTLTLDFTRGLVDPHFYNYGTVYLYLLHMAILIGIGYGWLALPQDISQYQVLASLYLTGRWISVAAGVLTCWLVWEIGKRIGGYRCAMVSTLLMAMVPLHALHNHFLTTDSTATLFTTGVLLASLRLYETGNRWALVAAGTLTALSAATRYNAVLVGFVPMLALWFRSREFREGWIGRVVGLGGIAVVGFLVFCPGVWLNPQEFWRDLGYEAQHVREGHGLVFVDTGLGWIYHYWTNLRFGLGLPLLLLSSVAFVVSLWARSPKIWLVWVFIAVYYLFLGAFAVRFARYLLPLLPPLMVLTGWLIGEAWRYTQGMFRVLLGVVAGAVMAYTLLWTTALVLALLQPDVRLRALQWIRQELPPGTTIGFATIPWFYTPPLSPYWGELQASRRAERAREVTSYRLVVPVQEWDLSVLQQAEVVLLSQFEVDDALRVRHAPAIAFLEQLREDYQQVAQFDVRFAVGGWRFGEPAIPHDMLYPYPRLEVWRRR